MTGLPQPVARVMLELPGFGYTTPPTVSFYGGGGTGAAATATLNGVTGITLVTPGSGCTSAPAIAFPPAVGGGGTGAAATAIISGGVVTTVAITNPGSNYLLAPNVTFTGGCTVAPTAVANVTLGSVGAINLINPGSGYTSAPRVYLTGGGGTGAMAAAMLNGSLVMNGKNLVEGFDMEFGRMNAVLGSTPNPLAPTVGAGPIIGANFYVDPPTEILTAGQTVLWRLNHLGVDSHAIHFHLFNVQVVNRVDWTNTIKPPYDDEIGWKETIRTNPFEDIIVAIRPVAMNLPFALPDSNRLLDVTSPAGSTAMFQPVLPPPGLPAVAQVTNVMTNFGWEYVWHCHLLGHEENDMMRPLVFQPGVPAASAVPASLAFPGQLLATTSAARTVTLSNTGAAGTQSLILNNIAITGANAGDFAQTNTCGVGLPPGANCTISLTFTPTAVGARTASLAISSNGPAVTVPLSGTGILPPQAPTITSTPALAATVGAPYSYDVNATDANGGVLTYALTTFPAGMTINAGTGLIAWTPAAGQVPSQAVTVRVTDPGGLFATQSFTITVAPAANTIPATPTNLTAAITSATQVTLSWTDASTNETSFVVWGSVNGGTYTLIATVTRTAAESTATGGAVTYVNTGLTAGTTYRYYVRAVNAAGRSNTSNLVTVNFTGVATAPAAPTALVVTVQAGPAVLLTWTDNATNETGFQVERSVNGGAFTQIAAPGPSTTASASYTDTGVAAGNTYGYRVRAVNGTGMSAYSNTATAATSGGTPQAPTITSTPVLAATAGLAYSYDVNATDPNGDILTYSLTTFPAGMTINAGTGLIAWTPTSAQAPSQAVVVRVTDPGGLFATQSFTISVGTTSTIPATPTTLTGVVNSPTQITLNWIDASTNETSFVVWRSVNAGAYSLVATITRTAAQSVATGGAVTFVNSGLTTGSTYTYYVRAVNAVGKSATSNAVTLRP